MVYGLGIKMMVKSSAIEIVFESRWVFIIRQPIWPSLSQIGLE